jgi:hypothetical protein
MENIGKVFLATAIILIFALSVQAQSSSVPAKQQNPQQTATNPAPGSYVDKNNNGVCDNFESRSGNGRGVKFVDKNNDGVCDNRADVGKKPANSCRKGQGNQYRHGQGRGCGKCCRR